MAKLAEMRAEFCIFESNAPGLKANFYEPYVDMPSDIITSTIFQTQKFEKTDKKTFM